MSIFNKKAESEKIYVKFLEEAGAVTDDYTVGKFAALEKEMLNDIFENAEDDQDDDREYGEDFDGADDEWVTDEEIEDIVGGRFDD